MKFKKLLTSYADGCSFTKKGLNYAPTQFKSGYFVAITDNQIDPKHAQKELANLDKLAKSLNLKQYFYGWWLDKKTNKGYLDLSLHIESKAEALSIAQLFNQKAVFDCANLDSIYI